MPQDRTGRPDGKRPLTLLRRALCCCCLLAAALVCVVRPAFCQEDDTPFVLDNEGNDARYLITISGAVGSETFQGARGLLTVAQPPEGSANPYLIVAVGFPDVGARNTFYWNSQDGPMEVAVGRVRSRMTGRGIKQSGSHFFYLSPALFGREGTLTQRDDERVKYVEQTALPTKIFAPDGEMTLTVNGDRISGRVAMTGFDPVGRDYVRYTATFVGQRNQGISTKR